MSAIRVALAGSTGSIGTQALDVLVAEADRFELTALGATGREPEVLIAQARTHRPKVVALANKESLIAAGPVVQRARRTPGAELVPVDSEHGAIHQCLRATDNRSRVERLLLTASGGPFRGRTAAELAEVPVTQALAHPTWSMGPKITVDS